RCAVMRRRRRASSAPATAPGARRCARGRSLAPPARVEGRDLINHQLGVLYRATMQDVALPPPAHVLEQDDHTPTFAIHGGVVAVRSECDRYLQVEASLAFAPRVVAGRPLRILLLHPAVARDRVVAYHRQLRDQRGGGITARVLVTKLNAPDDAREAVVLTDPLPPSLGDVAMAQHA